MSLPTRKDSWLGLPVLRFWFDDVFGERVAQPFPSRLPELLSRGLVRPLNEAETEKAIVVPLKTPGMDQNVGDHVRLP